MTDPGRRRSLCGSPLLAAFLALAPLGCGGDTSPDHAPPGDSGATGDPAATMPGWAERAWTGGTAGGMDTQLKVRVGRHDAFDRLVLVFADDVPGYSVRYAEEQPRQCGSGRPVDLSAAVYATITLELARAHNEEGRPTVEERALEPGLPVVRAATLSCDFEGRVEWVVGLERRVPLRVLALSAPARLVVDFRHRP